MGFLTLYITRRIDYFCINVLVFCMFLYQLLLYFFYIYKINSASLNGKKKYTGESSFFVCSFAAKRRIIYLL